MLFGIFSLVNVSVILSVIFVFTLVASNSEVSSTSSSSIILEVNKSSERSDSDLSEKNVNTAGSASDSGGHASELSWISHTLSEELSRFRPRSRNNRLCNWQSDLYDQSLRNLTLWAVQMKESSAASTEGLLVGKRFHLGHYDECIAVQTQSVAGRYCLVNIKFAPTTLSYPEFYTTELEGETTPPYSSAWEAIKKSKSPYRLERDVIHWGICIPAACSAQDLEESLTTTFADIEQKHGITLRLSTSDRLCSSSIDDEPLPISTKALIYLLASLSALTICVTIYHLISKHVSSHEKDNRNKGFGRKFLMNFSMVNNFLSLCRPSGEKSLSVLDGWKFHSTIRIILVHRIFLLISSAIFNPTYHESKLERMHLLMVGASVVDTYLSVSGFLVFYLWYGPLKKHGAKIIPSIIINRWLRLLPSYLMLIIFTATLLPYLGDGPLWKSFTNYEAEKCQQYGWKNLLAVNNVIGTDSIDKQCAFHTWYLACDFQLFPLGVLIVYTCSRSHSLGRKFAFASLAASIIIPFSIVYVNAYDGIPRFSKSLLIDFYKNEHVRHIYINSYNRAGPYIIGIISGFLLLQIQENKWTLSVSARWTIFVVAVLIGDGAPFYGLLFYNPDKQYSAFENALFAAIHRPLWSIMICVVIVIHLAWGFGKSNFEQVLTHRLYVPLGRLSYLVYLFHPVWQLMTIASARSPPYLSALHIAWMVGGDIFICFLASLWLYLIFEGPVSRIRAVVMSQFTGKGEVIKNEKSQESAKID